MTAVLGCIADDFTGATDLAALLARSGLPVSLRIGTPESAPENPAPFEIIALKCRNVPAAQAVDMTLDALRWLQSAGARQFYWKYCSTFDSTPRGNIGPVAEALMKVLGCDQTIYCPAFPENGRTIFMGNLFVGRQPLAESPMKDHPLTPMRDSDLTRLLAPQVTGKIGLVDRLTVARGPAAIRKDLEKARSEGRSHVVVDAVADKDLTVIASACQDMPLLTGGSALAMPLPMLYRSNGLIPDQGVKFVAPDTTGRGVILSGSCSAMTRQQVQAYQKIAPSYRLDPIKIDEDGITDALDWLKTLPTLTNPMLYASAAPDDVAVAHAKLGAEKAGAVVENALSQIALYARSMGVVRFLVAGGETSGAVTRALGVSRLDIGAEIAPGVPWTYCKSDNIEIALALKSGNFGDVDFFSRALDMLEE